jgi:hypothetical protein
MENVYKTGKEYLIVQFKVELTKKNIVFTESSSSTKNLLKIDCGNLLEKAHLPVYTPILKQVADVSRNINTKTHLVC